jgi:hypothetical protein
MCGRKVKLSLYRPWRPIGLREVEAPTFSDIRLTEGGKVVSALCTGRFLPPGRFLVLIFVRGWVDHRALVQLKGLGKLKKSTSSRTWIGNVPTCSIVTKQNMLSRSPFVCMYVIAAFTFYIKDYFRLKLCNVDTVN